MLLPHSGYSPGKVRPYLEVAVQVQAEGGRGNGCRSPGVVVGCGVGSPVVHSAAWSPIVTQSAMVKL